MPDPTTIEYEVKRQVAGELENSMRLKDPGGKPAHRESWPWGNADKVTEAINDMNNVELLRLISEAVEARLANHA